MTYKEISKLIDELHGKDPYIVAKILIVAAVDDNLTTSDYNDKEYEKTCQRLFDFAQEKVFGQFAVPCPERRSAIFAAGIAKQLIGKLRFFTFWI